MRVSLLIVIPLWLTATLGRVVSAAPESLSTPNSLTVAVRRPAPIRSILFKIRDAKSLRRYSVLPLREIYFMSLDFPRADPPDQFANPRPKPRARDERDSYTYETIDEAAWQDVRWAFDLLRPGVGEDPKKVVCSEAKLRCAIVSEGDGTIAAFCFVRTSTGPKLQRIEVEPKDSMEGM